MKTSRILIAIFAVMAAAVSAAKAADVNVNFDGEENGRTNASLRDVITNISQDSGFIIPEIPARIFNDDTNKLSDNSKTKLFGINSQGKGSKIYLENIQGALKQRLIDVHITNKELINAVNIKDSKVIFDSEEIFITSAEFNVAVEIKDAALLKEFALLIPARNKGVCSTIITVGKRCNTWAQLICTAWELYNIYTTVCPPSDPSHTPPVDVPGGGGGDHLPNFPPNAPVRSVSAY